MPCQALVKEVELCSRIKAHPHVVRLLGACLGDVPNYSITKGFFSAPVASEAMCTSPTAADAAAAAAAEGCSSAPAAVPVPGVGDSLPTPRAQASQVGG